MKRKGTGDYKGNSFWLKADLFIFAFISASLIILFALFLKNFELLVFANGVIDFYFLAFKFIFKFIRVIL